MTVLVTFQRPRVTNSLADGNSPQRVRCTVARERNGASSGRADCVLHGSANETWWRETADRAMHCSRRAGSRRVGAVAEYDRRDNGIAGCDLIGEWLGAMGARLVRNTAIICASTIRPARRMNEANNEANVWCSRGAQHVGGMWAIKRNNQLGDEQLL